MTRKDMEDEGNYFMIKACFQPKTSHMSTIIFNAINEYVPETSKIAGGMSFSFQGIERLTLIKTAKKLRNINLIRYEYYIDLYVSKFRKLYDVKEKQNG